MRFGSILISMIALTVCSCKTVRDIVEKKDVPAISENKLLKNIESNEPDYSTLFAKRIDVSLNGSRGSNSFKASMKIHRDNFIQISVTAPLGIEVARILLTTDSMKFVDVYHKKYFLADYGYFDEKYDTHIGFDCIQNILTNVFFNFENCGGLGRTKRYKLDRTDVGYQLSTLEERTLPRKLKKLYKKKRKNKDFILILQKILIDPQTFRPMIMSVEDVDENVGVSVKYESFKDYSGRLFPGKIVFDLNSEHEITSIELKIQRLEFDIPVECNFKISSKYKQIE